MFTLSGLSADGYRCFPRGLALELRPLTLLYGPNNAGKSAVLRLLPILADSLADGAHSPFDLRRTGGADVSFLDVLARGGELRELKRLVLTLVWSDQDGAPWCDEYQLKYIDEADRTIVAALMIRGPDGRVRLHVSAEPYPDYADYRIETADDQVSEGVFRPNFAGLVPESGAGIPALVDLRERLLGLRHHIQWLTSVRGRWDRLVTKTGDVPRLLGSDGARAAEILLTDQAVFDEAARWYADPDIGRQLQGSEYERRWRILLNPRSGDLRDIDLLDTGEGMIQVLPVLVAAALARQRGIRSILAIEEPESHLHGNAQAVLARHLCELAAGDAPPTLIVETHSRILLLGVQLAIAEGRLSPERCCAYWTDQEATGESILTRVTFDRHGRPQGDWPRAAFDEDQTLARHLLDRQMQGGAFG